MMKIGYCVDWKNREHLSLCKKKSLDFIELNFNSLGKATDIELEQLVEFLYRENLPCQSFNGLFPGDIKLVGEQVDYQVIEDYLYGSLERFKPLKAPVLVFGSGKAREIPEGFSKEKAKEQIVELLKNHIAPIVKKYGIICAIEPLNYLECNFINTCMDAMEFIKLVNKPEIKLLADIYHMNMNKENMESLMNCSGYIEHVHIASANNNRYFPSVSDGEDYAKYLAILRKANYKNECISIEGRFEKSIEKELTEAVSFLRQL